MLLRYRIEIKKDPATSTNENEEFMTDTQEIYEAWKRETEAEGVAGGPPGRPVRRDQIRGVTAVR